MRRYSWPYPSLLSRARFIKISPHPITRPGISYSQTTREHGHVALSFTLYWGCLPVFVSAHMNAVWNVCHASLLRYSSSPPVGDCRLRLNQRNKEFSFIPCASKHIPFLLFLVCLSGVLFWFVWTTNYWMDCDKIWFGHSCSPTRMNCTGDISFSAIFKWIYIFHVSVYFYEHCVLLQNN